MPHIAIISASVRTGRASHRVALFFRNFILGGGHASADIIDLMEYNFPVFEERLTFQVSPDAKVKEFAERIKAADAVIIVTPEYNGGYPASLKNVTDLLYEEWYRKPVGIVTVSNGPFGGSQVVTSLLFTLWKIKAWVVPVMFPVPKVEESYNEAGEPKDQSVIRRAEGYVKEILWCIEAKNRMSGS